MLEAGAKVPPFTIPTDTGSFSIADNPAAMWWFFLSAGRYRRLHEGAVAFSGLMERFRRPTAP